LDSFPSASLYIMQAYCDCASQMMKVEAEVRKDKFTDVDFALKQIGVPGLTVAEEKRAGRGLWSYPLENVPHLILTVVVADKGVERVVESIRESASTKSWGAGRIVVSHLEGAFDIGSRQPEGNELTMPSMGV
jgi:nitrogen regulatory protein PII